MKRKFLSILLTLAMVLTLLPTAAMAEGETAVAAVAKVGETEYATLAEAVAAVADGGTVTLLKNATGGAVGTYKTPTENQIQAKSFTIDFGGYIYTVTNPAVGSTGYESQAFHLERSGNDDENHKVTFKNGTITTAENFGGSMLIQNYCDLTLENMTIIGDSKISYVISNNFGSLTAKGNTVIKAADGKVAFDLWYGMNSNGLYDDGVSVTFGTDFTGSVTGKIEYGAHSRVPSDSNWKDKARLTIANGNFDTTFVDSNNNDGVAPENFNITISGGTFTSDVSAYVPNGYIYNSETKTVEPLGETNAVAKVGDTSYYKTLPEAVAAAQNGEATTITLLTDVALTNYIYIKDGKNITLDLNGHTITRAGYFVFRVGNAKFHVTGEGTIFEDVTNGFAPILAGGSSTDVAGYTTITIDENVTLKGDYAGIFVDTDTSGTGSYNNYGLVINMKGSIDVKRDGEDSPGAGIYVNGGNKVTTGNVMQINLDGTRINAGNGQGIYAAGYAKWNLKNCTFNAEKAAIELRAGEMTINGGSYTATDVPTTVEPNGNGSTTDGAAIAVCQHTTRLSTSLTINGGTFTGFSALYEKNAQHNSAEDIAKVNLKVAGGRFATSNGGTAAVYSENKTGFITGGLFSSEPAEKYIAENHYVDASNNGDYPYTVKEGTKPAGALIVVKDTTAVTVPDSEAIKGLTNDDKTNIANKSSVDGVAEAITDNKADLIPADVNTTDAKKVEIEVTVKVNVTSADMTSENKTLTFEASPVATITVTKANGTTETKDNVKVPNSMLNGQPITVKLPLPADFNPEQIKHISSDGSVEYFLKTAKRGANTFEIKDGCAVFTITKFSTFELSGTVTYVEPSYYSGSSSAPTYSVTVDKTENGSVTVSPKSASKGSTVTITVKPDSGYTLETLTAIDSKGKEIQLTNKGEGKYTFTMPADKVEVKATFMDDNTMLNFFVDVKSGDYYYDAVLWAAKNGITSGTDAVHFSPEQPCTRAQIVTFLWRAAGSPEPKTASSFTDVSASAYYAKAVAWAVENGITTGTTTSTFSPDATCTRAQSVTFLYRALKGTASGSTNFTDVAADAFYADAVAWAVESGVTNGTTDSTFSPNNDCTRAQIVTFLYRAYNK